MAEQRMLLCAMSQLTRFGGSSSGVCPAVLAELFANSKAELLCSGSMCCRKLSQCFIIFE